MRVALGAGDRSQRLLVAVAVVEITWIATRGRWPGASAWVPLLAAVGLHGLLVARERRTPSLSAPSVAIAVGVVALAAVIVTPVGSRDVYQYAFYGRMATHLGADPYVTAPRALHHDGLYGALAPGWHGARSVYGPVFTWFSAVGARGFGTSALAARLWFQGAAALALVASARHLLRRAGPAAGVAVGLSPVLVAAVNGGHNDVLVGWLVLVALGWGAGSAAPGRAWGSGAVLGVATCVKVSAAPALAALVLVAAHRRAWRQVAGLVGGWAVVTGGAYGIGGGAHLLGPLASIGGRTSRASAWGVAERLGATPLLAASAGATAAAVLVVAWRWRRASDAAAVTAVGAAACFAAAYVLPWYPATVLPASGRALGSRAGRVLQAGSTVLLLAYVVPAGSRSGAVALAPTAAVACGVVLLVLVVVLVGWPQGGAGYRRSRGQPRPGARRRGGLPGLSAPGGVARGGGPGEAGGVPRRGVLGAARPRLR